MPKIKRILRRIEPAALAEPDEQLWPINCLLLIFAGCVSGMVLASASFDDPRLLFNAWTQLSAIAVIVAVLLFGTARLARFQRHRSARRMQLAVLMSLFVHFLLIVAFHEIPLRLGLVLRETNEWIDDQQGVTLPDYGRVDIEQIVEDSATQPVSTSTPEAQTDDTARSASESTAASKAASSHDPAAESRHGPQAAALERAAPSAPRRSSQRSGAEISRSETAPPAVQTAGPVMPRAPAPSPQPSNLADARDSAAKTQQTQVDAERRPSRVAPRSVAVSPAQLERQLTERRPDDSLTAPNVLRATPEAAAIAGAQPEATQPAASSAEPAALPEASSLVGRSQPALPSSRQPANPEVQPSVSVSSPASWSTRRADAEDEPLPSVTRPAARALARSEAQSALPDAPAAAAAVPEARGADRGELSPQVAAPERSTTGGTLAGVPRRSSYAGQAPSASRAAQAAQPQAARPSQSNGGDSRIAPAASLARSDVASGSISDQASAVAPAEAPDSNAGGIEAAAAPSSVARSAASGRAVPSRAPAASATTAPSRGGPVAAAGMGRATTARSDAGQDAGRSGQAAQVARSDTGLQIGGAGQIAEPAEVSAAVAASDPGGGLEPAAATGGQQRSVASGGVQVARRSDSGRAPQGSTAAGASSAVVSRAATGGGQPNVAVPSGSAGGVGRAEAPAGITAAPAEAAAPAGQASGESGRSSGVASLAESSPRSVQRSEAGVGVSRGASQAAAPSVTGQGRGTVAPAAVAAARSSDSGADGGASAAPAGRNIARSHGEGPRISDLAEADGPAPGGATASTSGGSSGESPAQVVGEAGRPAARQSGPLPAGALVRSAGAAALPRSTGGIGAAAAPGRAASGQDAGPQLASQGTGTAERASLLPELESGAELAEDPGPVAGDLAGQGSDAGKSGTTLSVSARTSPAGLPVKIAAKPGVGGVSSQPAADVGLPNRLARPESQVVHATIERFVLDRSSLPSSLDGRIGEKAAPAFQQRDLDRRPELARSRGGSESSERAVEMGLDFLARHQNSDGRWSLHRFHEGKSYASDVGIAQMQADTAATGLSLLAFLGAGYTHRDGKYRDVVAGGLQHLIEHQKPDGDLFSGGSKYVWLYSHGIAAIALCEAYGMTRDEQLRGPAQRAVDFIVAAQHPTQGGWRYAPQTGSDTSVSGWQVMALRSGELAGLNIPPTVYDGVRRWLDTAHPPRNPALYVYRPTSTQEHQRQPSNAMTAEGLVMRLYTGWSPGDPAMLRGAEYLQQNLPRYGTVERKTRDLYYWYYGTQAMFHVKGPGWEAWNNRMRDLLSQTQVQEGPLRGSWNPGGAIPDRWGDAGGRMYVTTMSLLILEVYYRHLPLYQ